MDKPKVGDKVRLVLDMREVTGWDIVRVDAVYDPPIEKWWDTPTGENKVSLMDALEQYGPEKAATATWYAEISNVEHEGESMAVASFECEPYNA